jgi:hypothetical protein
VTASCNDNENISFHFIGFTMSRRVMRAIRAESFLKINGGPATMKVELVCTNNGLTSAAFMSQGGSYRFTTL